MKIFSENNKWTSRSTIVGIFSMILISGLFWIGGNIEGAAPYIVSIYATMVGANKVESLIRSRTINSKKNS